jgi:CRISPR-associated protein Cas5, N-terminal domain
MSTIVALHVKMEGFTAFFKHPLTITGTQISLPCPPYSTLLGMLSAIAGRVIQPSDTRIGFEFRCSSRDIEIEKTDRLSLSKGILSPHREGQGIIKRYIYFRPELDLYVTNLELEQAFKSPVSTPSFGRSQDIAWIKKVEKVQLTETASGKIGPTLIPEVKMNIPSLLVRCPEWFENNVEGRTRLAGPFGFYQGLLPTTRERFSVTMANLYNPSNLPDADNAIYLHQWLQQ